MAFVNASLLFGSLLVGIPILLHLMMRRRPKPLVFPAFQFLQSKRQQNQRSLQMRHWILLLLRCLVLALLALALARPSVQSTMVGNWTIVGLCGILALLVGGIAIVSFVQQSSKAISIGLAVVAGVLLITTLVLGGRSRSSGNQVVIGDQEAPVAAVLIMDNSVRMTYLHANEPLLDKSKEMADWLIRRLPSGSDIAIADALSDYIVFSVDQAAAISASDRIECSAIAKPLNEVVEQAIAALIQSPKKRKEIYLLTDLTAASWNTVSPASSESDEELGASGEQGLIRSLLEQHANIGCYVVDLGVKDAKNVTLADLRLSTSSLTQSGKLSVRTSISAVGEETQATVELLLEKPNPRLPMQIDGKMKYPETQGRGSQIISVTPNASEVVDFQLQGLPAGVHHGQVRVTNADGLAIDNVRHFTIQVQPTWNVLMVAGEGAEPSLLVEAIAPYEFRETGRSKFACETIGFGAFADVDLDRFPTICLLDPPALSPRVWQRIAEYVASGGNAVVMLGHNAEKESFNQPAAQSLLPGNLDRQWRASRGDIYLAPDKFSHPILAPFAAIQTTIPWQTMPVFRHWGFGDMAPECETILEYNNGEPAIVQRNVGRGRCVVMTTPVTDPSRPAGRKSWNEIPTAENAWPYVVLMDRLMTYLLNSAESKLNYSTGQFAGLVNDPRQHPDRYQLFVPGAPAQDIRAQDGQIAVKFTEKPGAYRLKGKHEGTTVARGFSVNVPQSSTNLTRLQNSQLDELLGEGRYELATRREDLTRDVGEARIGTEFYPVLLIALALLLALEQTLANRFYRKA